MQSRLIYDDMQTSNRVRKKCRTKYSSLGSSVIFKYKSLLLYYCIARFDKHRYSQIIAKPQLD